MAKNAKNKTATVAILVQILLLYGLITERRMVELQQIN